MTPSTTTAAKRLSPPAEAPPLDVAVFLRNLAGGGIERMRLHLAEAFLARGLAVELVLGERTGALADEVPRGLPTVELGRAGLLDARLAALRAAPGDLGLLARPVLLTRKPPPTLPFLPGLARYLRQRRPRALLAATPYENLEALRARRLARCSRRTRVVISEHNNIVRNMLDSKEWARRHLAALMRRAYPEADGIVAVSNGVADQIAATAGLARGRITTIHNPVVTPALLARAAQPTEEPWLAPDEPPLIMGAGRLVRQKDFPTLIRAFALARARRPPLRLLIAGGADSEPHTRARQAELMALATSLGVADAVRLPGHLRNPVALMAHAALFVLSSRWEGFGNVLVEALACGTPVVSTDCPSGPAEILDGGRYGRLVPVGDAEALAEAILATLDQPPDPVALRARAGAFTVERATDAYLGLLLAGAP
jgi:glycosyltransferase involved in cell wall biosynthesis